MNTFFDEVNKRKSGMYSGNNPYEPYEVKPRANAVISPASTQKNNGAVSNPSGKLYVPAINYTANQKLSENVGDWNGAMDNEYLHNTKEGDLGLGWGVSGKWNYSDPQGYGGQLEAKRNEINNYKPFEYDYTTDDAYLSMKKLKEKEADKAYADGYAQLSTAFDGDIPVNMMNKLLTTKNEIIDSADSYIPQLRQMAYDMYNVERNDLYNQYGLLSDAASQDYNRWDNDRSVRMQGIMNKIANEQWRESFDYGKERDAVGDSWTEKQWDYGKERDAEADSWKQKQWDYGVQTDEQAKQEALQRDIESLAVQLAGMPEFPTWSAALAEARRYYMGAA